jgi:hypothetical protein
MPLLDDEADRLNAQGYRGGANRRRDGVAALPGADCATPKGCAGDVRFAPMRSAGDAAKAAGTVLESVAEGELTIASVKMV